MIVLKLYTNRKLYGEIESAGVIRKGYLNLSDVANLIRQGKDVSVIKFNRGKPDHGEDVTLKVLKSCLTQLVISDIVVKELINRYKTEE